MHLEGIHLAVYRYRRVAYRCLTNSFIRPKTPLQEPSFVRSTSLPLQIIQLYSSFFVQCRQWKMKEELINSGYMQTTWALLQYELHHTSNDRIATLRIIPDHICTPHICATRAMPKTTIGVLIFAWVKFSLYSPFVRNSRKFVPTKCLSVARTPSRFGIWTVSLLFHCTMALLCHSKQVNGHLPGPTVLLSADVLPSVIWQGNLTVFGRSRNGTPAQACRSYNRLTAKQRAQIGRYAMNWEQRNCHVGYSSSACTRGFTPLPCSSRGSPSLPCSGKSDSPWCNNCTCKSQPCHSLDLKSCKLSALPLTISCGCKSQKIESAKILLNRNLEDFSKIKCRENNYAYGTHTLCKVRSTEVVYCPFDWPCTHIVLIGWTATATTMDCTYKAQ